MNNIGNMSIMNNNANLGINTNNTNNPQNNSNQQFPSNSSYFGNLNKSSTDTESENHALHSGHVGPQIKYTYKIFKTEIDKIDITIRNIKLISFCSIFSRNNSISLNKIV